jgi:amino acid adenylation domain-containing protein
VINTNTESRIEAAPLQDTPSLSIHGLPRLDYPQQPMIGELVTRQAQQTPNNIALASDGLCLTYRELEARSNQLAHHLRSSGVCPDTLVGICLERSPAMVVAALGILKAGGAYIPLEPDGPAQRLEFMMHDSAAPLLISRSEISGRLPAGSWQLMNLDQQANRIATQPATPPLVTLSAKDLAYVIYTSGSTGQPKGVMITNGGLLNLIYWHREAFSVNASDRASQVANIGFDAAVWEIWPYLSVGASVHIADDLVKSEGETLRDWLLKEKISIAFVPSPLAESMMNLQWPENTALRTMLTGGDMLRHFPPSGLPFRLFNNYGLTECTVVSTSGLVLPGSGRDTKPSIGRPISNVTLYILDEKLCPVAPGQAGELYVGGVSLARGYVGRDDLNAKCFINNPFDEETGERLYKTGDLVRHLPNGEIAFLGRVDDQIKIRGYRIEPFEIATALNQHPHILDSVVLAREDVFGEKRLVGYIIPAGNSALAGQVLRDFLRPRLPDYMLPTAFVTLPAFPCNRNGKIDVRQLPAPNPADVLGEVCISPRGSVEAGVASILASLLHVERVGTHDNFFELGGHSLLGTQVISRVRDRFGVELTLRTLFDRPTVAGLSAAITSLIARANRTLSVE